MTATLHGPIHVREVALFERPVTLRLPFRFGAATVTRCTQAFVRVGLEVGGRRFEGASAELMVPKWFDKSPELTHEQNFEQLREALRGAPRPTPPPVPPPARGSCPRPLAMRPSTHWSRVACRAWPRSLARRCWTRPWLMPCCGPLARAGAKACALACWATRGAPRCPLPSHGRSRCAIPSVWQTASRPPMKALTRKTACPPRCRTPSATTACTHFKLKLSRQPDADVDRLSRIAAVLEAHAKDWRVTLDGNETFSDAQALGDFWRALAAAPAAQALLQRTLLLEQPIARKVALAQPIDTLGIAVPVIIDESDDHDRTCWSAAWPWATAAMATQRLGIIMHGVTGRMGTNQHLVRSIVLPSATRAACAVQRRPRDARPDPRSAATPRRSSPGPAHTASRAGAPTSTPRWPTPTTRCSSTPAPRRCAPRCWPRPSRRQARLLRKADRHQPGRGAGNLPAGAGLRPEARRGAGQAVPARPAEAEAAAATPASSAASSRCAASSATGCSRATGSRAAPELELPQGRRRRHHPRHAVPLALRARQPVRRGEVGVLPRRHAHPAALGRERQALQAATADDAAYATFELTATAARDRPDQHELGDARARDDLVTFHVDGTHGSAVAGLHDCRTAAA
jgi:hypothetical protein